MSVVVAIFLVVIVAILAASAVSVGNATRESSASLLYADRAQAAAEAALEWAAYRLQVQGVPCATFNPQVLQLNLGALRGFRVTVSCQQAASANVFDVTAFAQQGNFGQANYASYGVTRRLN
jgi:hypothetical protein